MKLLAAAAACCVVSSSPIVPVGAVEQNERSHRELQTSSHMWVSSTAGSSSSTPKPGATSTSSHIWVASPEPTKKQTMGEEPTFLGFFKTEKLYMGLSLAAPAIFILYKFFLFVYFMRYGRRQLDNEISMPAEDPSLNTITSNDDEERHQMAVAIGSNSIAKPPMSPRKNESVLSDNAVSVAAPISRDQRAYNQNGANFWIEEELQAWRIDFQQLKTMKCITTTVNQRRHAQPANQSVLDAISAGPSASEMWLATYYAMDSEQSERLVVLKWISPQLQNTETQQEKLKMEIRRQAKLRHPNIATFYGISWSPETNLVAVTEYMARGDLRQWLHRKAAKEAGRWSATKLKILLDITNAIVYMHNFQPRIIHGNLNSRNVLLNDKMQAKLSDFGASTERLTDREIMAYNQVGSGRWISPEALIGRDGMDLVSDAMDVYALGILMVELDTHELPFSDLMQADRSQLPETDILQLIASGALTPTLTPTCHPRIQELVNACTQYNPQKRPSSRDIARVLRKAVEEAQARPSSDRVSHASSRSTSSRQAPPPVAIPVAAPAPAQATPAQKAPAYAAPAQKAPAYVAPSQSSTSSYNDWRSTSDRMTSDSYSEWRNTDRKPAAKPAAQPEPTSFSTAMGTQNQRLTSDYGDALRNTGRSTDMYGDWRGTERLTDGSYRATNERDTENLWNHV
ncbi:hypothetical protein Poli38472_010818 [Pythium oligandrum]|uniref:Protein kinase domain-containing protein n=1 Tax=Pythium oligandrum TaxID=41045 RepID=A0A8K1FFK4_PYTOL|nr:hypothetical protein Poli38472_010818 [Pythium oligandrum]|eukprot:TMW61755.1 hypothetical protein Poli38472_010818 [Pythium oligandrum]